MDGIINLLKPAGMTSSDVVGVLRRMLNISRIGHTGTLDPDAAGVLPICIGKATRLFDYLMEHDKEYLAEVTFGKKTDTQDAAGKLLCINNGGITRASLERTISSFIGEVVQSPSAYSAIRIGGKHAYDLARRGASPEMPKRKIRIDSISILRSWGTKRHLLRVNCSRGTYIRTLAADLGDAAGCGAYLSFLLRTRSGAFDIDSSVTLEEIACWISQGRTEGFLLPMDYGLTEFPALHVSPQWVNRLRNGGKILASFLENSLPCVPAARVYCGSEFYGMVKPDPQDIGTWRFATMLWSRSDK